MVQLKKPKRIMTTFVVGLATLFILAGCSSDNENETSSASADSNENNTETLYEGADEVVLEYTEAHYEYNIPVLFDLAPPKVQEEYLNGEKNFFYFRTRDGGEVFSEVPIEDLIDNSKFEAIKEEYNNANYIEKHDTFFQDFNSAENDLFVVRFDHQFEQTGELAYFVKPWMEEENDPNAGGKQRKDSSGHLKVKQNDEGEWKVVETTSGQFREEGINTSDSDEIRAKGTVVHERTEEDPYGF